MGMTIILCKPFLIASTVIISDEDATVIAEIEYAEAAFSIIIIT